MMLDDSLMLRFGQYVHRAASSGEVLLVFDFSRTSEADAQAVIKEFLESGYRAKEVVRSVVMKTVMVPTTEPTSPPQAEVN